MDVGAVGAHGAGGRLVGGERQRRRFVGTEGVEPTRSEPFGDRQRVGQMALGVLLEGGKFEGGEALREAPQHRVHQPRGAVQTHRLRQPDAFRHRDRRRDAVDKGELIGPEPKQRGHRGLELVEAPVENLGEQKVEAAAPAQRPVDELGGKGAVARLQTVAVEGRVEREVRVGSGAVHALEHAKRHEPRGVGRRAPSAGCARRRRGTAAQPRSPARRTHLPISGAPRISPSTNPRPC